MRCSGHCCRRFALEKSPSELQSEYLQWKKDPHSKHTPGIETIANMVIPLKSSQNGKEHLYTCKHLQSNGDCGIYEVRPQMCRDFPLPKGCHFWSCTSDESAYFQLSFFKKLLTRYRWLKSL